MRSAPTPHFAQELERTPDVVTNHQRTPIVEIQTKSTNTSSHRQIGLSIAKVIGLRNTIDGFSLQQQKRSVRKAQRLVDRAYGRPLIFLCLGDLFQPDGSGALQDGYTNLQWTFGCLEKVNNPCSLRTISGNIDAADKLDHRMLLSRCNLFLYRYQRKQGLRITLVSGLIGLSPPVGIPDLDHRGQDVVPGLRLHHDRIGKHATVPAKVPELPGKPPVSSRSQKPA